MPRVADLHMRTTPTMSGTALNLGPNEMPIDRAVELTRRLDAAAVENQVLASRIRTLEAKAEAREQAINESYRLVESSAMEVSRARSEVAVVKREIDALRERIRVMEQNEIETLKLVIAKLEQLLRQQE
jgi:chromosome segregation ATPase